MRGDRDCTLFAFGFLGHALVEARDDAEALAGWSFAPDYQTALFVVAKRAGGLVASGALDPSVAFAALFKAAHKAELVAALGLPLVRDIVTDGVGFGADEPADFWGWRNV